MITGIDLKQAYLCVDCYAQHQQFLAGTPGVLDTTYVFETDQAGLEHLDDTNEPTHQLAIRIIRKLPEDYPPVEPPDDGPLDGALLADEDGLGLEEGGAD